MDKDTETKLLTSQRILGRKGCLTLESLTVRVSKFSLTGAGSCLHFLSDWSRYLMNQVPGVCMSVQQVPRETLDRRREGNCQQVQSLQLIQFVKICADCMNRTHVKQKLII